MYYAVTIHVQLLLLHRLLSFPAAACVIIQIQELKGKDTGHIKILLHFVICHSKKYHGPRTSSCHKKQQGGTQYGLVFGMYDNICLDTPTYSLACS